MFLRTPRLSVQRVEQRRAVECFRQFSLASRLNLAQQALVTTLDRRRLSCTLGVGELIEGKVYVCCRLGIGKRSMEPLESIRRSLGRSIY